MPHLSLGSGEKGHYDQGDAGQDDSRNAVFGSPTGPQIQHRHTQCRRRETKSKRRRSQSSPLIREELAAGTTNSRLAGKSFLPRPAKASIFEAQKYTAATNRIFSSCSSSRSSAWSIAGRYHEFENP